MDQSLSRLRDQLERQLTEEDDLRRALALQRKQGDPPVVWLEPGLDLRGITVRRRRGRPRNGGRREDWIQAELDRVRRRRDQAARRFVEAAKRAERRVPADPAPAATRAPAPATPRVAAQGGRGGVPGWAVGLIVVLAVLLNVGGSGGGSTLLSVLGLAVAVLALVPTSVSAYFDYQAHRGRREER